MPDAASDVEQIAAAGRYDRLDLREVDRHARSVRLRLRLVEALPGETLHDLASLGARRVVALEQLIVHDQRHVPRPAAKTIHIWIGIEAVEQKPVIRLAAGRARASRLIPNE